MFSLRLAVAYSVAFILNLPLRLLPTTRIPFFPPWHNLWCFLESLLLYINYVHIRPAHHAAMASNTTTHLCIIFHAFSRPHHSPAESSTQRTAPRFDREAAYNLLGCLDYFANALPCYPTRTLLPAPEDASEERTGKQVLAFPLRCPHPDLRRSTVDTLLCTGLARVQGALLPFPLVQTLHKGPGPGLALFDMDSTLIQSETIDELASALGEDVEREVAGITARAMAGELDFGSSLRARVALLQGVPVGVWGELEKRVEITSGARELVWGLKRLGYKTAVVSGGFLPLARWLQRELELDYAFANQLVVDEARGVLTGELDESVAVVDAERKREVLRLLREQEGVAPERVIAVGDGANDLLMLKEAGLGVAYNAKERVKNEAMWMDHGMKGGVALDSDDMCDILYFLGLSQEEQKVLTAEKYVPTGENEEASDNKVDGEAPPPYNPEDAGTMV